MKASQRGRQRSFLPPASEEGASANNHPPSAAEVRALVKRIVSGGQTGVDRGALDAAIELRILHGGWCPQGRLAEDGIIPPCYHLRECAERDYRVRTEKNVVDSDGTLIIYRGALSGGTKLTRQFARQHNKPYCVVKLGAADALPEVRTWLMKHNVRVINVAGPRESTRPGITQEAKEFLRVLLSGR